MASLTRRQLAELKRLIGDPEDCPECRGMFYAGTPGLFVVLAMPHKRRNGTNEDLERYFYGCPACGEQLRTEPIIMSGLKPRPDVPDPWPISEWPPIRTPKPGNYIPEAMRVDDREE